MTIFSQNFTSFYQNIEKPFIYLHELNKDVCEIKKDSTSGLQLLAKTLILVGGISIYTPIAFCLTPISLLGDAVHILGQKIFLIYNKSNENLHLKEKIITSVTQHFSIMTANIVALSVIQAGLFGLDFACKFTSNPSYSSKKELILLGFAGFNLSGLFLYAKLKNTLGTKPYTIYSTYKLTDNNGICFNDPFRQEKIKHQKSMNDLYNSWQQKWHEYKSNKEQSFELPHVEDNENDRTLFDLWDSDLEKFNFNAGNTHPSSDYRRFKSYIVDKINPFTLMGLENDFNLEQLNTSYKKFAVVLHPDHNSQSSESVDLMKCLNNVKALLEIYLKETQIK